MSSFSIFIEGLIGVDMEPSWDNRGVNRGFCLLEYSSIDKALAAKTKILSGEIQIPKWTITASWADPFEHDEIAVHHMNKALEEEKVIIFRACLELLLISIFRFRMVHRRQLI